MSAAQSGSEKIRRSGVITTLKTSIAKIWAWCSGRGEDSE